jgi:hypothetical protein
MGMRYDPYAVVRVPVLRDQHKAGRDVPASVLLMDAIQHRLSDMKNEL